MQSLSFLLIWPGPLLALLLGVCLQLSQQEEDGRCAPREGQWWIEAYHNVDVKSAAKP